MASMDLCDGDYLGAYRRFLEHFVANVCGTDDQLPVKMGCRDVRECEVNGAIADITLQHLNQRICPPSLQSHLVKLVMKEFKEQIQKQPEECGYRTQEKTFSPLKLMQAVTSKVNEICQRFLDNSRLALLPPPPSIPLPLASSHAIKNRRRKMEDRSVVLHDLHTMFSINNEAVVNYYAVFDGHGGQETAVYCAAHLHQYLLESPYYPTNIEVALRDAFFTTDSRFTECDDTKNSGATAVCALLYDKTLYIAWAGDSQAALIKNRRGINLTDPHKPERKDEKERIERLGGEIIYYGSWRVNGVLNVSRSIGDNKYKPYISQEPEIQTINLDGSEDFLVIACDGFWEKANEDIVASLLYEYVTINQSQYSSASEGLVSWAKQNRSDDNISVIVVFLTPPDEIAAKNFYYPRNWDDVIAAAEPGSMDEPGYQDPGYDFPAKPAPLAADFQSNGSLRQQTPPKFHYEDDDEDDDGFEVVPRPAAVAASNGLAATESNGKHSPPQLWDGVEDVGPETNVDDLVPEDFGKLDQAMAPQHYPDEFLLNKSMSQREAEAYAAAAAVVEDGNEGPRHELSHDGDNVGDSSEESEEEWNYFGPTKEEQEQQAPGVVVAGKDPALVEKPDPSGGEKELCSPKPSEDDDDDQLLPTEQPEPEQEPKQQQEEQLPASGDVAGGSNVANHPAELEDEVTAEFDELHQNERQQPPVAADDFTKETTTGAEADTTAIVEEDDLPFDKEQPELDQKQLEPELNFKCQDNEEDEDMDYHLNPDAAEFVPVSPTNALSEVFGNDLISGSPLKNPQRALKNRLIPSEEEFKEEISSRPSDIDDTTISDFSNGDLTPLKSTPFSRGGFEDSKQGGGTMLNFDDSEVSSTKAEFGDDTVANFSTTSEFCKTGLSNIDSSYTGSDRGGFDFSNPMTTSMTPSDFKTAFEQEPDLNQVHELKDEDLLSEVQNGIYTEKLGDNKVVEEEDDLGKDQIEVDMEKLPEHQKQNIEVFSAKVEERYSDNKDLFMNTLNTENSSEFKKNDNDRAYSPDAMGYANSNPFASGYAPSADHDLQSLADGLKNINIEEPKHQEVNEGNLLAMDEPAAEEKPQDEVMQNPLSLNLGIEKNSDESILVSPVKDPEVMSSKFAEEEDISTQEKNNLMSEQDEVLAKPMNHIEDFSCVPSQPANLSENLQDFTELENGIQESQLLKENLVDELKDVEDISPSQTVDEPKLNLTNESNEVLSNEVVLETKEETPSALESVAVGAAAVAAAAAATAVVAADATKSIKSSSTAVSKTTKLSASKPAAKSSTLSSAKTTTAPAKKPATTTAAPRTKSATAPTGSKPLTSAANKIGTITATKTNVAAKTATNTAPKATSRPATATSAASKPRPLSSVTSKVGSTSTDKKATTNGTVAGKSTTASKTTTKPTAPTAISKTGLVNKTSSATRTSSVGVPAAPKPRPASATASKTTAAKPSTGLTNSTTSTRPKTAPTSTTGAVKSKITSTTKSPMIDKQIKETANKQISSARGPAVGGPKARQSLAPPAMNGGPKRSPVTTKTRQSLAPPPKTSTANSTTSPAKKPAPITNLKPNLKNVTSKINSKVTTSTKNTVTSSDAETKPIQNGVCESNETVITSNITTTTVTTNIEEDLPKKDVSPIEQPTDNQLITAE